MSQNPDSAFQTIGLIGKPNHPGANTTLISLYQFLTARKLKVYVEEKVAESLALPDVQVMDLVELGKNCDLAIVVGGDGNMLGAARVLAEQALSKMVEQRGKIAAL